MSRANGGLESRYNRRGNALSRWLYDRIHANDEDAGESDKVTLPTLKRTRADTDHASSISNISTSLHRDLHIAKSMLSSQAHTSTHPNQRAQKAWAKDPKGLSARSHGENPRTKSTCPGRSFPRHLFLNPRVCEVMGRERQQRLYRSSCGEELARG